ncbi:MAG: DUF2279 domain-containing protein [Candidatus Zixiibacteriota bacterium]
MKQVCWFLTITISLVLLFFGEAGAKSYLRDGHFKRLPLEKDWWYYIDRENWYIKAPDKWQHFMGSYALAEVVYHVTENKGWTMLVTVGLGILKEYDDAYREGWSVRDIYMDLGGVAASTLLPDNIKLLAYYNDKEVMFKLSLPVH